MKATKRLIRPLVHALHPYVPGEQPKARGLTKLNTNENPYPPSPRVLKAVRGAVDGRLRLYPKPSADGLRVKLAKLHGCKRENILIGNGSDELLALATRAFVEPRAANRETGKHPRPPKPGQNAATIQFFDPSYSLYPVLTAIHGAIPNIIPLEPDFSLPSVRELKRGKLWDFKAALTFITTPNAPSGRGYGTDELESLCRSMKGVVILDEAYVDFAEENAMALALRHPHVIISRTFSKAYSLCFQRIGYFVGHASLIGALHKIRDSYNVNGLGQVAAEATLADLPYYRRNFNRIKTTREETTARLTALGFEVLPSQTSFILMRPPGLAAQTWSRKLRARGILVRWFSTPGIRSYLRITISSPVEMRKMLHAVRAILRLKASPRPGQDRLRLR